MAGSMAGRIVSLHLHPRVAGEPMARVDTMQLVAEKGILDNTRYFGRTARDGQPARRQVTLIEREVIAEHAAVLGVAGIAPGAVRSNIETLGVSWGRLLGRQVRLGDAILLIGAPRTPCHKMDAVCDGLRALMENGRQGVLAQVVQGGTIRVGDSITAL